MNRLTFQDLGLNPSLLKALDKLNYQAPTPIQSQAIPILLEGHDLLATAQTGTGKTASFVLPLLQGLLERPPNLKALWTLGVQSATAGAGSRIPAGKAGAGIKGVSPSATVILMYPRL
jgi:ATP-dependent helicase YprA (DUF1998 family)